VEAQQQIGFGAGVWEGQDQLDQAPDGDGEVQATTVRGSAGGVLRARNGAPLLQGTTWATDRLSWVWEGVLAPGLRTIFASRSIPGSPGGTNAGHGLGRAGRVEQLGGKIGPRRAATTTWTIRRRTCCWTRCCSSAGVGAALAGGDNTDVDEAGDALRRVAEDGGYVPGGTIAVTNGSAVVTRAAGGFTANVDAGMLMFSPGGGGRLGGGVHVSSRSTRTRRSRSCSRTLARRARSRRTSGRWR
jgi:hypothetical protein